MLLSIHLIYNEKKLHKQIIDFENKVRQNLQLAGRRTVCCLYKP